MDYLCVFTDRDKYAAVTATYHDKKTGQTITVSTGENKPAFILRHTYASRDEAIRAAKDKLSDLDQGTDTIEVSLAIGNPALFAESPLVMTGFRTGISGVAWTTNRVEHNFSTSGFTTRVSGNKNKY